MFLLRITPYAIVGSLFGIPNCFLEYLISSKWERMYLSPVHTNENIMQKFQYTEIIKIQFWPWKSFFPLRPAWIISDNTEPDNQEHTMMCPFLFISTDLSVNIFSGTTKEIWVRNKRYLWGCQFQGRLGMPHQRWKKICIQLCQRNQIYSIPKLWTNECFSSAHEYVGDIPWHSTIFFWIR